VWGKIKVFQASNFKTHRRKNNEKPNCNNPPFNFCFLKKAHKKIQKIVKTMGFFGNGKRFVLKN